jgi:hypothetical protein
VEQAPGYSGKATTLQKGFGVDASDMKKVQDVFEN